MTVITKSRKLKAFYGRVLNARPDTIDFRDKMFEPTLREVPSQMKLEEYLKKNVPLLDQGSEGACTGFGLVTVIHFLLKTRQNMPCDTQVSPRMIYEMAKKYDEWEGEDYVGSSARGAIKGWHKHGVCLDSSWPYNSKKPDKNLTAERAANAAGFPLGSYYRVNHKDFTSMHNALAEVGVLYATARVHDGWFGTNEVSGEIPYQGDEIRGAHAFAIVGFNEVGFWIQNSWGDKWGKKGCGLISYDDWAANATDVWVTRLGAPVKLQSPNSTAKIYTVASSAANLLPFKELRSHIISLGNNGNLKYTGTYGNSEADVERIFTEYIPAITSGWKKVRIAFYAHGGLTPEESVLQVLTDYRQSLLVKEIYPIFFVWHSDLWSTIKGLLQDAFKLRQPEERVSSAFDFLLDRIDDMLEPLARGPGKLAWEEMKQNARLASAEGKGGADFALACLERYIKKCEQSGIKKYEQPGIHLIGHSAGSIFLAPFIKQIKKHAKFKIRSCTLWAPACTSKEFIDSYIPSIQDKIIEKLSLFTLTDRAEQDDNCGKIYNKSLLYLVSNAFEETPRNTNILGMAKYIENTPEIKGLIESKRIDWITSPNTKSLPDYCGAKRHGDFDNDIPCFNSTVDRILLSDPDPVIKAAKKLSRKIKIQEGDAAERAEILYPADGGGEAGHLAGIPIIGEEAMIPIAPSPDAPQMFPRMSQQEFKQKRDEINFEFNL